MPSGAPEVAGRRLACWVCRSTRVSLWKRRDLPRTLEPDDLRITDSRYGVTLALWRCRDCHFIFADGDELATITSLYERLSDPGYETSQEPRALQMRSLLRSARGVNPGATSVLDVGAGTGLLVAEAARCGLTAVGVELSRALVDAGRQAHKVELLHGTFPHPGLTGRRFDLVFLVDVIEHVVDPVNLLQACRAALTPQGVLVVVTPDAGSVAARLLGRRWWHFRLAHVGYFDATSLAVATQRAGLVTVSRRRAKWFFRVAYLAERAAVYLPIGWLNRRASQSRAFRWLYDLVLPLDLHDSYLVFLRHRDFAGAR